MDAFVPKPVNRRVIRCALYESPLGLPQGIQHPQAGPLHRYVSPTTLESPASTDVQVTDRHCALAVYRPSRLGSPQARAHPNGTQSSTAQCNIRRQGPKQRISHRCHSLGGELYACWFRQVVFWGLSLLCFTYAFSRLRWCCTRSTAVDHGARQRFGRTSRQGSLNWDRVTASLLIALSDGSVLGFQLILLADIVVQGCMSQQWQDQYATQLLFSGAVGALLTPCSGCAGLWHKITICTNTSLFIALPLAFFLDEASGVFGANFHHRVLESLLVPLTHRASYSHRPSRVQSERLVGRS